MSYGANLPDLFRRAANHTDKIFRGAAAQGNAGVNELRAIVTDEQDTRLPIDARASVIVLAAQLEALGESDRSDRKADQDAASLERGEPAG